MLFYRPHTATRYKFEEYQSPTSKVIGGSFYGDSEAQRGQLLPMTAQSALERTGAQQDRPHEWLWDGQGDNIENDLLVIAGRWFVVCSPQEIFDAEPITAHRRCVVKEIEPSEISHPEV